MAEKVLARRTSVDVMFGGTDITNDIKPYLTSIVYTDDADDLADDLKIQIQDRDKVWLQKWLTEAVEAAAGGKLSISAVIRPENWKKKGTLKTGAFELDSVDASGPPATVTINSTSLAFSNDLRQTKKSKAWKNYNLSGIASEIAGNGGLSCQYEASTNPSYDRVEQTRQSDIEFLRKLCQDAGISIKVTDGKLVLYDQAEYEAKAPVLTIEEGAKGGYIKYKLHSGSADTQYAKCRVRYLDPNTGKCIEGTAEDGGISGEKPKHWRRSACACITSWQKPPPSPCRETWGLWPGSRSSSKALAAGTENTSSPERSIRWAAADIPRKSRYGRCWTTDEH